MQHESGRPARAARSLPHRSDRVPAREDLRLLLRQVAAHREGGLRQEDGVAVVASVASFMGLSGGAASRGIGVGAEYVPALSMSRRVDNSCVPAACVHV